jgi:hypothetical protein
MTLSETVNNCLYTSQLHKMLFFANACRNYNDSYICTVSKGPLWADSERNFSIYKYNVGKNGVIFANCPT